MTEECRPMTNEEQIEFEQNRDKYEAEALDRQKKFEDDWRKSPEGKECFRKMNRTLREISSEDYKDITKLTSEDWNKQLLLNGRHSYGTYVLAAAVHLVSFPDRNAHELLCSDFPGLSGAQASFAEQIASALLDAGIIEPFFD